MNIKERLRAQLDNFAIAILDGTRTNGDKERMDEADHRRQKHQDAILAFPMLGFRDPDDQPELDGEYLFLIRHVHTHLLTIRSGWYHTFDNCFVLQDEGLEQDEYEVMGWMPMPDQGYLQDMVDSV